MTLAAPGSIAAHNALRTALTLYRLAEAAFDAKPDEPARAQHADDTWLDLARHALNCGRTGHEPSLEAWAVSRCASYARAIGREG